MYKITNTANTQSNQDIEVEITQDMLDRMTPMQREVITLRMAGYSFREIARRLELAEMSVRTRYNRGMEIAISGKVAKTPGSSGSNTLTPEQLQRFLMLKELKSVQRVADQLGLNQMSVRSSLKRAANLLGTNDIWAALNIIAVELERQEAEKHGKQLSFDDLPTE